MPDRLSVSSAAPIRYDAAGKCLNCGGVGGCHSLDCPTMAAKYAETENAASERDRLLRQRDEAWRTIAQQRQFHKDILAELDFWRRRAIELGAAETEWWAR